MFDSEVCLAFNKGNELNFKRKQKSNHEKNQLESEHILRRFLKKAIITTVHRNFKNVKKLKFQTLRLKFEGEQISSLTEKKRLLCM